MLSKNQVVRVRKSLEAMYQDTCTVIGKAKTKTDGVVSFSDKVIYEDVPCRLSYSSSPSAGTADGSSAISQSIKLFIAPEYAIDEGSKITVTHLGSDYVYRQSGIASVYDTHQEIELEAYDRWA